MTVALETLVKQLSDSGIVAPTKLENFVPPKAHPKSIEELVNELLKQNCLTAFQAKQIAAGKAKALVLGNYLIADKIGAGGMGQVFKAEHRRMHRTVAIKMLPPAMVKDPAALARFEREVTAAAKLTHPNIVGAFDADEANGVHFLVMEYVEGHDLSALVKKNGPMSVANATNYVLQAAKGLAFAHAEGVVHRDIKPANLLLDKKGVVKILDMGLARVDGLGGVAQAELTTTGAVMGTVDYMAPEQALNTKYADQRADIYSLGITLFYLITGRAAYGGDSIMEKLLAHREQPIPSLKELQPTVSDRLQSIYETMVAKKADDRYQSMSEVVLALEAIAPGGSTASVTSDAAFSWSPSPEDRAKLAKQPSSKSATHGLKGLTKTAAAEKTKYFFTKIIGGSFATIIAPIMVFYVIKHLDKPAPPAAAPVATATSPVSKSPEVNQAETIPSAPQHAPSQTPQPLADSGRKPGEGVPHWKTPAFQQWVKATQALPAEKQLDAVSKKLMELNPGFDGKLTGGDGKETPTIKNGVVTILNFRSDDISDISPVRALVGLKILGCAGTSQSASNLFDLSPLEGMPLESFDCHFTQVSDLSPIQGMPLGKLYCHNTNVLDLTPLEGMPLKTLQCDWTSVSDLSPLAGMNLTSLRITPKNITKGMDVIRQMKGLAYIGFSRATKDDLPPAEFWKRYDAGEFGQPQVSPVPPGGAPVDVLALDVLALDVLALVDPKKDAPHGGWNKADGALVSLEKNGANAVVEFPLVPQPAYRIEATVERRSSVGAFNVGLMVGSSPCYVGFDANKRTGLCLLNGKLAYADTNPTMHDGVVFFDGRATAIVVEVTPESVRVTCDDKSIIDWKGDSQQLSLEKSWSVTPGKLWLGSNNREFRVSKLTYTPLVASSNSSPRPPASGPAAFVYLDDLPEKSVHVFNGLKKPGKNAKSFESLAPNFSTTEFSHSLSFSPGGKGSSEAFVVYDLAAGYQRFEAELLRRTDRKSPLFVEVRGDGKVLWGPKNLTDQTKAAQIDLDLRGMRELTLVVRAENSDLAAHVLWIEPRLTLIAGPLVPPPIDLLKTVRTDADGIYRLKSKSGGKPQFFETTSVPDEYVLELDLQRKAGSDHTEIVIVVGGKKCSAILAANSAGTEKFLQHSGLALLDGTNPDNPKNPTSRQGKSLDDDAVSKLVAEVRKNSVRVTIDGRQLFEWTGDPSRLSFLRDATQSKTGGEDRLGIVQWQGELAIHRAILRPLTTSAPSSMGASSPLPPAAGPAAVVYLDELPERLYQGLNDSLRKLGPNPDDAAVIAANFPGESPAHALIIHPDAEADAMKKGTTPFVAVLSYDLPTSLDRFQARVRARVPGRAAPISAEVWGDGKKLWESGDLVPQKKAGSTVDVDIRGVRELQLIARATHKAESSHTLWIDPRLTPIAGPQPTAPSPASIDLLAIVDPSRQALKGTWKKENGALFSPANQHGSLELPVEAMAPYRIDLIAERKQGTSNLVLFLPIAGHDVKLAFESGSTKTTGLDAIDGIALPKQPASQRYEQPIFHAGQPTTIAVEVTPTSIRAVCDGVTVVDWQGKSESLSVTKAKILVHVPGRLILGTYDSQFEISKLTYTSLAEPVATAPTVDLLKTVKTTADGVYRLTVKEAGFQPVNFLKTSVPEEYALEYDLKRKAGSDRTDVVIVVGGRKCTVRLAANSAGTGKFIQYSGLALLDGLKAEDPKNPTSREGHSLNDDAVSTFVVEVRKGSVRVTIDGRQLFEWTGDPNRLSPLRDTNSSKTGDEDRLAISQWNGEIAIHRAILRPLSVSSPQPLDPSPSFTIPAEALTFGGHRYLFVESLGSWDEAKTKAEAMGGHLATIASLEENSWIASKFIEPLTAGAGAWLGATNSAGPKKDWRWLTGEPFDFTQWSSGEPNGEPALVFRKSEDGIAGWNDMAMTGRGLKSKQITVGYVVEWDTLGSTSFAPGGPAPSLGR